MSARPRIVVLFFRCDLRHDRLRGLGTATRMATIRASRGVGWHSDVRALDGILLRHSEQKYSSTNERCVPKSDCVKMRSHPAASPNQEQQEKKRWVEPVT